VSVEFSALTQAAHEQRQHFDGDIRTFAPVPAGKSFTLLERLWRGRCNDLHRMVDSVPQSLEKYMDVLAARQKMVASNIANIDTPGYKTQDVDFQTEFAKLLNGTSSGSIQAQEPTGLRVKNDGNNVDIDREARLLSENSIRFSAASNLLKGQLRMLKSAIHDGQGS
jgi:flagellar basal-body rod protein FlgB